MKIRIAIVDDLIEDRSSLSELIRQISEESVIDTFPSADDFLKTYMPDKYDLVFLDICMDEINGVQLATKLRKTDPHLLIVFQTTSREYAFDTFPLHPFDYLMKPCRMDEVEGVIEEAIRVLSAGDPEIRITAVRATYNVPLRSIIAIVSQGHNVDIFLNNNQSLTSTETFKSVSEKLGDDIRFLQINRGVIINMDYALSPAQDEMKMKDGSSYPIRINGRTAVLSAFSQYMISRLDHR
ncbi:MAG: response regulator transcription factor [Mogibacterium sp.]|nr:response regulator transcription factor [Mogibacterium sp.]